MGKVSIMKRGNVYQYRFEIASQGGNLALKQNEMKMKAYNEYLNTGRKFELSNVSFSDYLDYWMKEYFEVNYKYSTAKRYRESLII